MTNWRAISQNATSFHNRMVKLQVIFVFFPKFLCVYKGQRILCRFKMIIFLIEENVTKIVKTKSKVIKME